MHTCKKTQPLSSLRRISLLAAVTGFGIMVTPNIAIAQTAWETPPPALSVINNPLPPQFQRNVYSSPSRAPEVTPSQLTAPYLGNASKTVVGQKVESLRNELSSLRGLVAELSERLRQEQIKSQELTAEYYASVATIQTQLRSGTTPGNPRLIKKLATARNNLENLSGNIEGFGNLSLEVDKAASMADFMLDNARTTYNLSGALEEDHVLLSQVEDGLSSIIISIDRLQADVNADAARAAAYLSTERENLHTLALAISAGSMFGNVSRTNDFVNTSSTSQMMAPTYASTPVLAPQMMMATPPAPSYMPSPAMQQPANAMGTMMPPVGRSAMTMGTMGMPAMAPSGRPLAKIKFNKNNVAYEQPIYLAVNEALKRQPNARFQIVSVHPESQNSAQAAIESTKARRNAERVMRSLMQMGLTMDRINMTYSESNDVAANEVRLFVL